MAKAADDEESLKRLGGGRWQTRDERFTIEPQSSTWVVVDGEQNDDLGLPLVRGPFGSLTAAKEAIAGARATGPPVKPLPRPSKTVAAKRDAAPARAGSRVRTAGSKGPGEVAKPSKAAPRPEPEPSPEPRWIGGLAPATRRRARDAIKRLTAAGAPDPEGMTRRDIAGGVPAIATYALSQRLRELGPNASLDTILELLIDGRDEGLGVRWRLVDGEGRPMTQPG